LKISIDDGSEPLSEEALKAVENLEDDLASAQKEPKRKKSKLEKKELPKKKKDEISRLEEIINNLTDELKMRESELVTSQEKTARAVADADNYKKRMAREAEERSKYATESLVKNLLPALDNLDNASQAAENEAVDIKQLSEGVRLTRELFLDILKKHGLSRMDVVDKPFDPATSEAIQMEETIDREDGEVIREFAPGYMFKGRVVRHAKVLIAKNHAVDDELAENE